MRSDMEDIPPELQTPENILCCEFDRNDAGERAIKVLAEFNFVIVPQARIAELEAQLAEANAIISNGREQVARLECDRDNLTQGIRYLEAQLAEAKETSSSLELTVLHLKAEIVEANDKIEGLRVDLEDRNETIDKFAAQLSAQAQADERMRKALEPFERAAYNYSDCSDERFIDNDATITVANLREARAVLSPAQMTKEG
jgi:chromosome segregation ATPase